jgi:hypothetical protein
MYRLKPPSTGSLMVSAAVALLALAAATTSLTSASDSTLFGDVDCNGAVNPGDSLNILRHDAGLAVNQQPGCPAIESQVDVTAPDEMRLLTVATGSVELLANGGDQVPVEMQNQAFTQEAGSGIMFITTVSIDNPDVDRDCSGYVAWNTLGDTLFLPDTTFVDKAIWGRRQTFFLPSVAADTYYPTMSVGAWAADCPEGFPTITVDVEVQVWAFG